MGRYSLNDPRSQVEFRFWNKVEISDNGCWKWLGYISKLGYGSFYVNQENWMDPAHRVAWTLVYGVVPSDIFVLHQCDNRSCVRPDHLFLGTQGDNMRDCSKKGRFNDRRGENNAKAKLTADDVINVRRLVRDGSTFASLAPRFGVSESTISRAAQGQSWNHIATY